jgi:hypothetical protein
MIKAKIPNNVFGLCWLFLLSFWVNAYADWTEPVRISEPGGCWYPQIVAKSDTLHVVYTNNYGGDKISYVRSTDGGLTWSEHIVLSDTIDTDDAFFPRIMVFASDLIVLWKNTFSEGVRDRNIGYSISHNDGLTWIGPDYIFHPNWQHILYFSAAASGSVVNIILNGRIQQDLVFFSVRSTDFGSSWSEPEEIFRAAMSGKTDQVSYDNTVHYTWAGIFNWEDECEVYFLRSTDGGISWSENNMISDNDQILSKLPSLCTDGFGNVAVCWWDYKYSPGHWINGDILLKQSFDDGATLGPEDQV